MAKLPIGYIFSSAVVKYVGPYANTFKLESRVNGRIYKLLLSSRYIPDGRPLGNIKKNSELENLVVIEITRGRYGRKYRVACVNYWDELKWMYYGRDFKRNRTNWQKLLTRWEDECGIDLKDNFKIEKINPTIDDETKDLYALRGKGYLLPVWGCKNLDHLEGKPLFSPNGALCGDYYTYKTDTTSTADFPKHYDTAIISDENGGGRTINIFYHGFIFPIKWHHCIWKHIFALTRKANKEENGLWKNYWNETVPTEEIFSECESNEKDLSCNDKNCIKKDLFKDVHAKIKGRCQKFSKEIVTSFESNTTKYIAVSNVDIKQYKEIKIVFIKEIEIKAPSVLFGNEITQNEAIYQYAIFSGACYNWDQEIPVLHINTRTMFIDKCEKDRLWIEKSIGIVSDGRRNPNVIFTGTFKKVEKK